MPMFITETVRPAAHSAHTAWHWTRHRVVLIATFGVASMIGGSTGCIGERGTAPNARPTGSTLGSVIISPINAIMAVGGTLQISAVGQSLAGTPLADFDSVLYYFPNPADTERVHVTSAGLVTALSSTGVNAPVELYVIPFKGGIGKEDYVTIQVTDAVIPGVSSLSIHPVAPDSAKLAQASSKSIVAVIQNPTTHERVSNPTLRLTLDPADAWKALTWEQAAAPPGMDVRALTQFTTDVCCGTFNVMTVKADSGTAWVHAAANVYGTMLEDSVLYTFTPRYAISITVQNVANSFAIIGNGNTAGYLSPNGTVTITNSTNATLALPMTLTFSDSSAARPAVPASTIGGSSGDVTAIKPGQSTKRKFVTPGTYHWTATLGGSSPPFSGQTTTGTIVVRP